MRREKSGGEERKRKERKWRGEEWSKEVRCTVRGGGAVRLGARLPRGAGPVCMCMW